MCYEIDSWPKTHYTGKPVDFVAYLVYHIQSKVNDYAAWRNKIAPFAKQRSIKINSVCKVT